jgi:O-acetyl-ADP-ribose deacetylase
MPTITFLKGDITQENVDAIVNAANSSLMGGGGVDGAIHRAGGKKILEECKAIVAKSGSLPAGGAVITSGGRLAAKHVIHTVGPMYHGGTKGEPAVLESAYRESLARAQEAGLKVVSFPSISTGVFGYPVVKAAPIAIATVWKHLAALGDDAEARFVLFDAVTYREYVTAATVVLPPGTWQES